MTIYIVTSGEYSDYGIVAVFTDKVMADEFVKLRNDCANLNGRSYAADYRIEEYEANSTPKSENQLVYRSNIKLTTGEIVELKPEWRTVEKNWRVPEPREEDSRYSFMMDGYSESLVSQDHANKLCVEARQAWLRSKPLLSQAQIRELKHSGREA